MITFDPDDISIWHYRRQPGQSLPPELLAARREWLRHHNQARRAHGLFAVVSNNTPAEVSRESNREQDATQQQREEYRRYLREERNWDPGEISPYVVTPQGLHSEADISLFNEQMVSTETPEQRRNLEAERDNIVESLFRAVERDRSLDATQLLNRCGAARIESLRFEHDPQVHRDFLTLEIRVPTDNQNLHQRLFERLGRPGPAHNFTRVPPRERPMLRVQADDRGPATIYLGGLPIGQFNGQIGFTFEEDTNAQGHTQA